MIRGAVIVGVVLLAVAGCAQFKRPLEQRTTQGPKAEELWLFRTAVQNGREPTFDEQRHWEDDLDARIGAYLREHPEAANSLDVSTFRFYRQVAVGMTKEQVVILLGAPVTATTDAAMMEKIARRYWPEIKDTVTEAWTYPLGWHLFFKEARLTEITQYLENP